MTPTNATQTAAMQTVVTPTGVPLPRARPVDAPAAPPDAPPDQSFFGRDVAH
jgi:hypothetical protein